MLWFKTDFSAKNELENDVFGPPKKGKNIDDIEISLKRGVVWKSM